MDKGEMKHRWDDVVARLKQERDELALKVHLGTKDAAAEWEKLEAKWHEVKATKLPPIKEDLEAAASELKKGYEKIRKLL